MKQRINIIILLSISILWLLSSCNTASRKKENENIQTDTIVNLKTVIKRGIINNMTSLNDPNCIYSFYYPKDSLGQYPALILLDPHAKGTYTVSLYQELAEKYNIILLSSNNTKNQQSIAEIQQYINCMLLDATEYLPIDTEKIYIGGFSGMARAVYQIGCNSKIYKGIIAIGAGYPTPLPWRDSVFSIIQMAGFKDMNFAEVYESNQIQKNVSLLYMPYYFDGEHKWPADSIMEFAFLNFFGKNNHNDIANYVKRQYKNTLTIPLRDSWKKVLIYQSLRSLCQHLKYYEFPFNEMTFFVNKFESKNALKQFQAILKNEQKEKENLAKYFIEKDSAWWTKTINFYQSIKNKKNLSPNDYKDLRLLNFLSLLSYSYCKSTLQQNRMDLSRKYLYIYQQADPYNGDMLYFWSIYFAKLQEYSRSIDSLSKAIKLGFCDKFLIENESAYLPIKDSIRFINIVNRIK